MTIVGRVIELELQTDSQCNQLDKAPSNHKSAGHSRRSIVAMSLGPEAGLHQVVQSLTGIDVLLLQMLPVRYVGIIWMEGLLDATEVVWQGVLAGRRRDLQPGFQVQNS